MAEETDGGPNFSNGEAPWASDVRAAAAEVASEIVAIRRHLHQHPEMSMCEVETTRYLADRVAELGLVARPSPMGVGLTTDLTRGDGAEPATRRVGIRGDIDALPIRTASTAPYASRVEGVMHACGHDAHAAMVYGALAILIRMGNQGRLPWPIAVRGIFQPAEETSEGAPLMIRHGALDGVDCAVALHVDPTLPVGVVAGRSGPFTAACDTFEVDLHGRAGHSARPHLCVDALAAASAWVREAYARVPRIHDCRDPAVVSVGTLHAGHAANVVAGEARLTGTIRSFSEPVRGAIMQMLRDVSEAVRQSHGCQVAVNFSAYTPSLHNHPALYHPMARVASQLGDIHRVDSLQQPSMGAEDFAFFARHKPSCMMRLGIAGEHLGSHALHTSAFDIDERALAIGAQLLAATAIELNAPRTILNPPPGMVKP